MTTNIVEGFFSQLKRSIDGTHHHVSKTHLQRYLDQFDFMYSLLQADRLGADARADRARRGTPADLQATDQLGIAVGCPVQLHKAR